MSTTGNNERFWSAPTGRRFRFLLGWVSIAKSNQFTVCADRAALSIPARPDPKRRRATLAAALQSSWLLLSHLIHFAQQI
jgi:hypothetical protein